MALNEDFLRLASAARARIREVSPAEARAAVAQGAVLIDVRDADELLEKPPVAGAVNISRGRLELKISDAVPDKGTPVVLYCAGGNRGALAADSLQQLGYRNVANVQGGLSAWPKDEQ
ncbi:MAG: sulfurtransferase [Rhodocyclaceae bacterium]|nr:sulfurtransferase [Rhodocyclaceae bacterium]